MNTDPRAIRITNTNIRPGCDRFAQLYYAFTALLAQASAQNATTSFPTSPDDTVGDGSATDGRTPLMNSDCVNVIDVAQAFVSWCQTPIAAGLPGAGLTPITVALKASVNPTS